MEHLIAITMKITKVVYVSLCTILLVILKSHCAKILAIFSSPAYSHTNIMKALVKPLIDRGHEIDLVTFYPLNLKYKGFSQIDISSSFPVLRNNMTLQKSFIGDIKFLKYMMDIYGTDLMNDVLNSRQMRDLKSSTKKYELILRHNILSDPLEIYSHIFEAPSVGIITSVNLPWTSDLVGLPDNPAYIPNYLSSFGENMNFQERFFNTFLYVYFKYIYKDIEKSFNGLLRKYFGGNSLSIEKLLSRTSLILCNSHFTIHQSRAMPPNFIEIGGIHIPEERNVTLPNHLKSALDSSQIGVIYFSFGSMLNSTAFDKKMLTAILEALGKQPYKVFWKGLREDIPNDIKIPNNIHFEKWMPQLDMLCHPNTKLFIAHGGLFGIQEAVSCGIPILGIPFLLDQASNLQFMVEKNVAKIVNFDDIANGGFKTALKSLLKPKYKRNAENLSKLFLDRPLSPLKTAIYWIEYVIKHKGAPHLKSKAAKLSWYQYYLLDVITVALVILVLVSFILYFVCKKLIIMVLKSKIMNYICTILKRKIKFE